MAVCSSESTRTGFRHLATLCNANGREIATAKACYINRTWVRYEFESVLHTLVSKLDDEKIVKSLIKQIDKMA